MSTYSSKTSTSKTSTSKTSTSKTSTSSGARKPFCKVCKDAGKPESLYTSHYINDGPGKNGKVVCPTLLSQTCGYCKKARAGHTAKYCPELERKQHRRNEEPRREREREQKPAAATEQYTYKFPMNFKAAVMSKPAAAPAPAPAPAAVVVAPAEDYRPIVPGSSWFD